MKKLLKTCLLLLVLVSVMGQIDDKLLTSDQNKTSISIDCNSKRLFNSTVTVKKLTFNCTVPNTTYAEILTELRISSLDVLILNIEPSKLHGALNSSLFKNLNVTVLVIDYKLYDDNEKADLIQMKSDILYVLNEIKELEIRGVTIVEDGVIGKEYLGLTQCDRLETLKISASDLRQMPVGWLKHCDQLVNLRVSDLRQRNATKEIRRNLLTGAVSLKKLEILNSYIEELEDEVAHLVNLEILNVAHNQIHYALTTVILPNLVELDLSYNHIFSSDLLSLGVKKQPKLRVLSVDFNIVLNICDGLGYHTTFEDAVPENRNFLNLHLLQRFSLRGTITAKMCFSHLNMSSLEYFDLSGSRISALNFRALPKSRARYLEVNVSGCPIRQIEGSSFNQADYNQLHHEQLKITGLNITLECECDEYLWLARASREGKLKLRGALCGNGRELWTVSEDKWQCRKYACDFCTCKTYWQDNSTDMDCRKGELTAIPKVFGLRRLYASMNLVENINMDDIQDSLIYLDLSMNHIARLTEEVSKALFKNRELRVRMFGNPIICDCDNKPFIQELMDHFHEVEDYSILTCIDDGRLIREVDPFELCFSSSRLFYTILASSLGVIVGFIALITGLYYRFGKAAKVYLYSKGLCLFCIREDEIDTDREYDVFVSFSHKDEDFVVKNLLPGLESDPYNYKLCVHFRNWLAGELITAQINQSIKNSKRTIVVLSKSFLDSLWGLLEFRAAHLSSLKEGRTRLIIIVLDDILETGNLDGELKAYLRMNTYVKWGDPWFWDKVRYALPHRSVNTVDTSKRDGFKEGFGVRTVQKGNETIERNIENEEHTEDNTIKQTNDEEVDDTKDIINAFSQQIPIYQHELTDLAMEMEKRHNHSIQSGL